MIGYFAERVRPMVFVPVALAIAIAAGGGITGADGVARDFAIALVALAHFRMWDDLADRRTDAIGHPDRVLVRAASIAPFAAVCAALGAAALALTFLRDPSGRSALALLLLQITFGAWYLVRSGRSAAGDLLLLSKYPAILLIVAGDRLAHSPGTVVTAAVFAYAAACAWEAWHDPAAFSIGGHS